MVDYDPSIIEEFADKLYSRAASLVATCLVLGLIIGATAGGLIGVLFQQSGFSAFVGAGIIGALAYQLGREHAFALRLQAQTALCQMRIEANTRRPGASA